MEAAALSAERAYDLQLASAWHAAKFGALAQVGKLRGLSSYIGKQGRAKKSTVSAVAFFHAMKARGLPITITRVERS